MFLHFKQSQVLILYLMIVPEQKGTKSIKLPCGLDINI